MAVANLIVLTLFIAFIVFLIATGDSSRGLRGAAGDRVVSADLIAGAKVYTGALKTLTGQTTGSKKALLFGLNYTGTSNELFGCIQDVLNLKTLLESRGFTVQVLTDRTQVQPTRATMLSALQSFLGGLKSNDTGFIWYSGHGTLVGRQNAWVPLDHRRSGFLTEQVVRQLLAKVPTGVRLLVGSDSCYSGSFFDLKYDVEPAVRALTGGSADSRSAARALVSDKPDGHVLETRGIVSTVPRDDTEPLSVDRAAAPPSYSLYDVEAATLLPCDAVFVSGCRDNQTAADAYINAQSQGAMTWAFIKAARTSGVTLGSLQDLMRSALAQGRYVQVPQMSFSTPLNATASLTAFGL